MLRNIEFMYRYIKTMYRYIKTITVISCLFFITNI
jgi:hypothetical protein